MQEVGFDNVVASALVDGSDLQVCIVQSADHRHVAYPYCHDAVAEPTVD